MNKNKVNIFLRLARLAAIHPWLKIIGLILAVALWFYVRGEKV
jgi:hypothetical protein